MKLSVLDTRSPDHLPVLVPELERLGFHRYWATEHHSEFQSASPTIVAGLAAGITDHMRVGTAGVLLRAASALRIVEDFATLELFFPGRLDLGVAGALPSGAYATELQRDVPFAPPEAYAERVARLVELVRTRTLAGTSSRIGPRSNSLPELWMCGTSVRAARLAGSLGISFAYHHYLANPDQRINVDVGDAYRGAFVSVEESKPRLLVAAYGHCADSEVRAVEEWKAFLGPDAPQPSFVGTPARAAATLAAIAVGYGADELAIDCFAPSIDERTQALASLKAAMDGARDDADVAQAS
ncbi:MAG: LLM class flavin-dependent oxidoreductase [Deltaproteobacteria bacterium]|nr:LLM class flavin-dependent oxidoreductase [Kofleriaceae bacterium]